MSDTEYLRVRAQQELRAARNSVDRRTREVHLELADAYAFRARETQAMERRALFAVDIPVPDKNCADIDNVR